MSLCLYVKSYSLTISSVSHTLSKLNTTVLMENHVTHFHFHLLRLKRVALAIHAIKNHRASIVGSKHSCGRLFLCHVDSILVHSRLTAIRPHQVLFIIHSSGWPVIRLHSSLRAMNLIFLILGALPVVSARPWNWESWTEGWLGTGSEDSHTGSDTDTTQLVVRCILRLSHTKVRLFSSLLDATLVEEQASLGHACRLIVLVFCPNPAQMMGSLCLFVFEGSLVSESVLVTKNVTSLVRKLLIFTLFKLLLCFCIIVFKDTVSDNWANEASHKSDSERNYDAELYAVIFMTKLYGRISYAFSKNFTSLINLLC